LEERDLFEAVRQVPVYVVDALDALKDKIETCTCCAEQTDENPYIKAYRHGMLTDPVFLGQFMMMLFEYNDLAYQYLIQEDGQEVDFDKLQYAIVALDMKLKGA